MEIEKSKCGNIFNIDRYAVHDGPGIRTNIYLKGCPLRCLWCCNPEGQKQGKEVIKYADKCISCGQCESVCKDGAIKRVNDDYVFNKNLCTSCLKCVDVCPSGSMAYYGKIVTSKEIVDLCKKDKQYYERSGGGITLSGGEPTQQYEFSAEVLYLCKEDGIGTAIETCGFSSWENYNKVLEFTDYVLFDLKSLNETKHKKFTGVSNDLILLNLKKTIEAKKKIFIRLPLIPGLNDSIDEIKEIGQYLKELDGTILEVNLLPYHEYGVNKYKDLQIDYSLKNIKVRPAKYYDMLKYELEKYDLKVKIGG
ncbi:MAG: glycyl-radical enzyme activating protein [Actinobacteria bacterium]|nr:glycyl-radical enzyme activating protein [Actinomycetota bacterium]